MIYNIDKEQWKPVKGYEGFYEVSSEGRIKSCSRSIWNGHQFFVSKEKILRPNIVTRGYCQVKLSKDGGKTHCFVVHRLVAEAFLPNTNKSFNQINHINGIKTDNRICNLEWCDNSLNQKHAYKLGLRTPSPKAGRPRRKVRLIKGDTVLHFNSIAETAIFLGNRNKIAQLKRVLNKTPRYKTISGYIAEYEQ